MSTINPKDLVGLAKVRLWVVPPASIIYEALAMQYGAYEAVKADGTKGYGPFNWRENPVRFSVYYDAIQRHATRFLDGENVDPDSKVHHLAHLKASAGILIDALEIGNLVDDRPRPGSAATIIDRNRRERSHA